MTKGVPGTKADHGTPVRYQYHGCRCPQCVAGWAEYQRERRAGRVPRVRPPGPTRDVRILNHDERSAYGVTVTIRERNTGDLRVLVVTDLPPREATREAARQIDALEGDWCVESYSSPETIYTDLQGVRNIGRGTSSPEVLAFTTIRRADLLPVRPPFMKSDGRRQIAWGGTA